MYSQRSSNILPGSPIPSDNRGLHNAVHLISRSLVKQACTSSRDSVYANLLSNIWGKSQYATIEMLAEKRNQFQYRLHKSSDHSSKSNTVRLQKKVLHDDHIQPISSGAKGQSVNKQEAAKRKETQRNEIRNRLVCILRKVKSNSVDENERTCTVSLVRREGALDLASLRRLWSVPEVVFEATQLGEHFESSKNIDKILSFYDSHMAGASPDGRIFNILFWKESFLKENQLESQHYTPQNKNHRTISREIVSKVVGLLFTKRRSAFFQKNIDVIIEVVLYSIHPDCYVHKFRQSLLSQANFSQGLCGYEHSRSFTGSLANLALGKLNRLLKDLKAVGEIEEGHGTKSSVSNWLSTRTIRRYCAERDTLTNRALQGVHDRYGRRIACSMDNLKDVKMSRAGFVRMYLALVGSGTDTGLKYWFSVLDHDGDGLIGLSDVSHFYNERKAESEKRNGMLLADTCSFWVRLCAMCRVSPSGRGINLNALKELGREEREFVMCALLVRRADDGNLINVAATVTSDVNSNL